MLCLSSFELYSRWVPLWKFGLNSPIECRATCTLHQASSGSFGSWFVSSRYIYNNKSTTARSKTSHNKTDPLTATENISAFIVRNSCVSTAVVYDFVHGPIYCVTAPHKKLYASVKGEWLEFGSLLVSEERYFRIMVFFSLRISTLLCFTKLSLSPNWKVSDVSNEFQLLS